MLDLRDVRTSGIRTADIRPADIRPADIRPADVRPADIRPADNRLADISPSDIYILLGLHLKGLFIPIFDVFTFLAKILATARTFCCFCCFLTFLAKYSSPRRGFFALFDFLDVF